MGLLSRCGVTVLNQMPTVFRAMCKAHACVREWPGSVRGVIFGGERLDVDTIGPWVQQSEASGRPASINMYGITETTVHST